MKVVQNQWTENAKKKGTNVEMKNQCCILLPYFGKLPPSFQMFLKSCAANPDFHWIVFTDDISSFVYPSNVLKVTTNMREFKEMIINRLNMQVVITSPHKLCDFKPAYGLIFEDYLKGYDFWGFCDCDLVFGKLNEFITDELLDNYDKLFCLGHFQLFRNTEENNRVFMIPVNNEYWYRDSFNSDETTVFDEPYGKGVEKNINSLFHAIGKRILEVDWSMNTLITPASFVRVIYKGPGVFEHEKRKDALYLWENGEVARYFKENNIIKRESFLYMHFQQREMKYSSELNDLSVVKILGNGFVPLEVSQITAENFKHIKRRVISTRYLSINCRWRLNSIKMRLKGIFRHIISEENN